MAEMIHTIPKIEQLSAPDVFPTTEVQVFIQPKCYASCRRVKQEIYEAMELNDISNARNLTSNPYVEAVTCDGRRLMSCRARSFILGNVTASGDIRESPFRIGEDRADNSPFDHVARAQATGAEQLGAVKALHKLR